MKPNKVYAKNINEIFDNRQKNEVSIKQMWNLIHTSAAYLPNNFENSQHVMFENYINSILHFTKKSNKNFSSIIDEAYKSTEFNYTTRDNSCISLCNFHNNINVLLDKWSYPCNIEDLNERWGSNN